MLAKFENGYFLEVVVDTKENVYQYTVYDEDYDKIERRRTEFRHIDMYYPMNEIDYILEFCEPDDVKGKYKLLSFKTFEEYKNYLNEDPNGEWILKRQGDDTDTRYYKTKEAAQIILEKEYKEILEDKCSPMSTDYDDDYAYIGDEEYYQSWTIYQKQKFDNPIKELIYKIRTELDRVDEGVTQYSFELMSTDVAKDHIWEALMLLRELEEMI